MMKPAFSTVACPQWTLKQVAAGAVAAGFEAVELRTFGDTSTRIACDPALSSEEKTRALFHSVGVDILSLGTSVSFHEPIRPPVIGLAISDTERTVRAGKAAVDLAVALECPLVRVFGFDIPPREKRPAAIARIAKRLVMVADHAQKTGVRIAVENGGAFSTAEELAEILDAAASPMVGACYSLAAGATAGDAPAAALDTLGNRLWSVRVKDVTKAGRPCRLGSGILPVRDLITALTATGFDGPVIFEWDRLWIPDLDPAESVLTDAARQLYQWIGEASGQTAAPPHAAAR